MNRLSTRRQTVLAEWIQTRDSAWLNANTDEAIAELATERLGFPVTKFNIMGAIRRSLPTKPAQETPAAQRPVPTPVLPGDFTMLSVRLSSVERRLDNLFQALSMALEDD